jgi:hypothetical protein
MDKKRVVNLVIDYYVRQQKPLGFKPQWPSGRPVYWRDRQGVMNDGMMCSIGLLVDKSRKMEGFLEEVTDSESVKSVGMRLFRYINMPRTKENLEFLADVQTIHDQFAILMEKVSNEEGVVRYNPKVQNHKGKTFVEEMQSLVEKDYSYVNKVEK